MTVRSVPPRASSSGRRRLQRALGRLSGKVSLVARRARGAHAPAGGGAFRDVNLPREVHDARLDTGGRRARLRHRRSGAIPLRRGDRWVRDGGAPADHPRGRAVRFQRHLAPARRLLAVEGNETAAGHRRWSTARGVAPGRRCRRTDGGNRRVAARDGTMVLASGRQTDRAHAFVARPGAVTVRRPRRDRDKPSYLLAGGRLARQRVVFATSTSSALQALHRRRREGTVTGGSTPCSSSVRRRGDRTPTATSSCSPEGADGSTSPKPMTSVRPRARVVVAAIGASNLVGRKGRVDAGAVPRRGAIGTVGTMLGLVMYTSRRTSPA